ncbi:MAG: tRNA 2-thiouridine(34) synthase MnmA [Patescibacteria group bacterium]
MMKLNVQHDVSAKIDLFKETCHKFLSKINDPKIVTERLKKDIIKLIIDEVVIEGESVKIFATIPLPNKIHEREMDKTDIPGTFNAGATLGPVNETNMARIWNKHKQTNTPLKRKVFVAMSGGVDSSVAAALLKKQGFFVVGVFMKPWQDKSIRCLWQKDREDAMRVASKLDIPLLTWDFSKEYGRKVTQYMIRAYQRGITPNPDAMCNKEIKFGIFFKRAMEEGADLIATGHYARTEKGKLFKAKDSNKDQTYFLWMLTKEHLKKTLFPVGEYTKPEVRKLAKKFKLPTFDKKDSQGVCFIGPINMKSFLKQKIANKAGKIIHLDGRVLGEHDGAHYYTIGQRHGLNISVGGGPYYVIKKNSKKNIIYVGVDKDLFQKTTKVGGLRWVTGDLRLPARIDAMIRYRTIPGKAILKKDGTLEFKKAQRAITPGQSAVFYKSFQLLGGGIIQ